ncbi:hypothetical protein FNF27_04968 [Cafeteria roenbergensis]|uniref:Uncharacterized protein n=1 Tax=Cafeteria roenbergensis TaxID=33653 RepID=A0A5A8E8X5_CAFRO|nr:hypothetical protein FNF27_04968 [Cafeteria roenbergensis]|mmetsp:Transcript_13242/g.50721  ORF Transcript_13242/g.50721 Transcript_13242/m.50721 type:complete len:359 (+) Transcript_13242:293-1369(+)
MAAAAGQDALWQCQRKLAGVHVGELLDVSVAAPSSAAAFAATAGSDGVVALWRVDGHAPASGSAFFAGAGAEAAGVAAAPRPVAVLRGEHARAVTAVALGAKGDTLVSAGMDRGVCVWDVATARVTRRLFGHDGMHTDVLMAGPAGGGGAQHLLATAGSDASVCLWDLRSKGARRPVQRMLGFTDAVSRLAFSPRRGCLAAGCLDGKARVFDMRRGALATIDAHAGAVRAVAFGPLGELLAISCGEGELAGRPQPGVVVVVDAARGGEVLSLDGLRLSDSPTRVAFDPAGRTVVAASASGEAIAWDASTGAVAGTLLHDPSAAPVDVCAVAMHPNAARRGGPLAVTAGRDGVACVWAR